MKYLIEHEGITSFKLFMAYPGVFYSDDGQILRAMQTAADCGAMIMMHAENGIAIDVLVHRRSPAARPTRSTTAHPAGRLEAEATHRAIVARQVAGNVPLYIVHMSAGDALDEVAAARHARPQRVRRDLPAVPLPDARGAARAARLRGRQVGVLARRCARSTSTTSADLWKGLRMNELAIVSTDHCPFCMKDQKELGIGDFSKIPNGIGGVEHRMELIYQGVVDGELSSSAGSRRAAPHRRGCSGCTRRRASSPPAPTPTSSCGTRTARPRSASTTSTT